MRMRKKSKKQNNNKKKIHHQGELGVPEKTDVVVVVIVHSFF